jgi:hypothetical protein
MIASRRPFPANSSAKFRSVVIDMVNAEEFLLSLATASTDVSTVRTEHQSLHLNSATLAGDLILGQNRCLLI